MFEYSVIVTVICCLVYTYYDIRLKQQVVPTLCSIWMT